MFYTLRIALRRTNGSVGLGVEVTSLRRCIWALLLTVLAALPACSRFEPHPEWVEAPAPKRLDSALAGDKVLGQPVSEGDLPEDDIFALSPDMEVLAEELKTMHRGADARAEALHRTLLASPMGGGMGIRYSAYVTNTAAEAYAEREVNCLSFTLMYVAMARHMGLDARVNDVALPPSWDLRGTESLTLFRHVNAKVLLHGGEQLVVDLEMSRYSPTYSQTMISDQQARAQFYNNRAMELLAADQVKEGFLHLRKALSLDAEASYIWSNLGNFYLRQDLLEEAEAAYLQGLEVDPQDLTLISNLNNYYRRQGDAVKADYFARRARSHRNSNPYYIYARAMDALEQSDNAQAERLIQDAIAKEQAEPRFYRLAAQIYDQQGRGDEALAMREKAEKWESEQYL